MIIHAQEYYLPIHSLLISILCKLLINSFWVGEGRERTAQDSASIYFHIALYVFNVVSRQALVGRDSGNIKYFQKPEIDACYFA